MLTPKPVQQSSHFCNEYRPILITWHTLLTDYRRHPAQALFLLLGLSLGISMLLGTLLIKQAVDQTFNRAQTLVGTQQFASITPKDPASNAFEQQIYTQLRIAGHQHLMPSVTGSLKLATGQQISLQGIDIFATLHRDMAPAIPTTSPAEPAAPFSSLSPLAFSYPPYQLLVSASQAQALQLTQGQQLHTHSGQPLPPVQIVADQLGLDYQLLCDLRCAQQLLQLEQRLTSIILTQASDDLTSLRQDLQHISGGQLQIANWDRNNENQAMSEAFLLNITAIACIAFIVGCFIAYNAVSFSMLERRQLIQQLRTLGISNRQIIIALLLEFCTWSLLATISGSLLGLVIADGLLVNIGLTLKQMFNNQHVLILASFYQWWPLALGIALIATGCATAAPFYQLTKQKPLQQTADLTTTPNHYRRLQVIGIVMCLVGGLCTLAPPSQILGFVITFCWFLGVAFIIPQLLVSIYLHISRIPQLNRWPKLHWLIMDSHHNPQRLSVAMMALCVAIAAGIAVHTMVGSFRQALDNHLNQVLAEDIYLTSATHHQAILQFLQAHPQVALAYPYFATETTLQPLGPEPLIQPQPIRVRSLSNHSLRQASIPIETGLDNLWQRFHQGQGVLINQTLALRFQLKVGDPLRLPELEPALDTQVLGIYYNYGIPHSAITISNDLFQHWWPHVVTDKIGVFIQDNPDLGTIRPNQASTSQASTSQASTSQASTSQASISHRRQALINQLIQEFALQPQQLMQPQQLKTLSMQIFKQTFSVTQLLVLFILIIAAIGIYCACAAAQQNNLRQLTLLKILGVSQRQLAGLSLLQLSCNALIATLIAIPLGLIIAWAAIHLVLQYSFGWYFALQIQPQLLLAISGGGILIAIIAAAMPLYQQSRISPLAALRGAK